MYRIFGAEGRMLVVFQVGERWGRGWHSICAEMEAGLSGLWHCTCVGYLRWLGEGKGCCKGSDIQ